MEANQEAAMGFDDPFRLCVSGRAILAGVVMERSAMGDVVRQLDEAMDSLDKADGEPLSPEERVGAMMTSLVDMVRRRRPKRGMSKDDQVEEMVARAIYLLVNDDSFKENSPKGVIVQCDPIDTAKLDDSSVVRVVGYASAEEFDETVEAMREAGAMFGPDRTLRNYH